MNETITDTTLPEGDLLAQNETMRITCAEDGCAGCNWVHRRIIGETKYYVYGERASRAAYLEESDRLIALHGGQVDG